MDVFLARQPIFNKLKEVVSYELLYRFSNKNYSGMIDGDFATSDVINNSILINNIETITSGKKAFINFTKNLLLNNTPLLFRKDLIAIEVLENITIDHDVVTAIIKLKESGYTVVMDDFTYYEEFELIKNHVDIIKIDLFNTSKNECINIMMNTRNGKIRFLAEKVETMEDFNWAVDHGFSYFQGYFFSKPEVITYKDISPHRLSVLQLLNEINEDNPTFDKITNIIEKDVALSYKLLRLLNSAAFTFVSEIKSIKHALALLGIDEIKNWVTIISLREIGEDKPQELTRVSITRARFAELISLKCELNYRSKECFLLGLMSMLDGFMNVQWNVLLEHLPISSDIKNAYVGDKGPLSDLYGLILAYEVCDWELVHHYCEGLSINLDEILQMYLQASIWSATLLIA